MYLPDLPVIQHFYGKERDIRHILAAKQHDVFLAVDDRIDVAGYTVAQHGPLFFQILNFMGSHNHQFALGILPLQRLHTFDRLSELFVLAGVLVERNPIAGFVVQETQMFIRRHTNNETIQTMQVIMYLPYIAAICRRTIPAGIFVVKILFGHRFTPPRVSRIRHATQELDELLGGPHVQRILFF